MLTHSQAIQIAVNSAAEKARAASLANPKTSGNHAMAYSLVEGTGWEVGIQAQGRSTHKVGFRWVGDGPAPTECALPTPVGL